MFLCLLSVLHRLLFQVSLMDILHISWTNIENVALSLGALLCSNFFSHVYKLIFMMFTLVFKRLSGPWHAKPSAGVS